MPSPCELQQPGRLAYALGPPVAVALHSAAFRPPLQAADAASALAVVGLMVLGAVWVLPGLWVRVQQVRPGGRVLVLDSPYLRDMGSVLCKCWRIDF